MGCSVLAQWPWVCPPALRSWCSRGQTHRSCSRLRGHVPTVAASPQGSLIVILKDSTKSTWQFTRTHAFTEPGLQRAPRTRTGVHTHAERRPPGGPPHAHADIHPTDDTHLPPPSPSLVGTCSGAWAMQPRGTRKPSHNTEAHPRVGVCTSSLHVCVRGLSVRAPKGQALPTENPVELVPPRAP